MSFRVEKYSNEPILFVTLDDTFSVGKDLSELMTRVVAEFDASPQPVFYVVDMLKMKVSFEDVLSGANISARGAGSFLHHPNIREIVLVSSDKLITLSVQGLRSPVFGLDTVSLFPTVEEGLVYARERIAVSA